MKIKSKRWAFGVIGAYLIVLCAITVVIVVVDPYFHFHAPFDKFSYAVDDAVYANAGIIKNFDYDMIIIGASSTTGFSTAIADELFDAKSIRTTFLGEGFKKINESLQIAIDTHPDVKYVIRSIDTLFFVTDENWMGYDEYPDYLYDNDLWNDVYYIFNGKILCYKAFPEIIRTIRKEPAKSFDAYINSYTPYDNSEKILSAHERNPKEEKVVDDEETKEMFCMLDRNLEINVVKIIEENPNITFYLFFPPYSILWWDQFNQLGDAILERRIQMEKYAIEKLLPYDNVRLFSFNTNKDLICNFNNYIDGIHYISGTCTQIMEWIKAGEYELTDENYMEYIDNLYEFMCNYDFDALFEE